MERPLNKKYGISRNRHQELMHFTLQYKEWKIKIRNSTGEDWDALNAKIKLVESTAEEAAKELAPYILEAVISRATYENMRLIKEIPCGKNMFYELKRKYYYLLDKKRN